MISNQILQETLDGIHSISNVDLYVIDLNGKILAKTKETEAEDEDTLKGFINSVAESQVVGGKQYFKIFDDKRLEYVLLADGESESMYMVAKMAVFQIESLLVAYKERFDKDNFIKNLLLDNLLLVDIYNRAKKLNIDIEATRVAYLIEATYGKDQNLVETVKQLEDTTDDDCIASVDEKSIGLVKEVCVKAQSKQFVKTAEKLLKNLKNVGINDARIAVGTIAKGIKDVSRSYKEAQIALEVDKIFYENKEVVAYDQLGIGRLIYQLPLPLCKMFIKEVFGDYSPEEIDDETLATIYKFFENNLNVSETSRQLYIHRNTLVYRLDKIQKSTNLDLRNFEDAIAFKIALMVVQYMKHMNTLGLTCEMGVISMITLQNVTKEYQKGSIGLDNVSLEVDKGEFAFIVGKSGSGKTTLIKLLLKELEATSGDIVVNGYHYQKMKRRQIPYLRRQIGVVFQDFRLLRDRSIYENVAFAQQVIEVPKRAMKRQVQNVLELVGLGNRLRALPDELSGGEQQRVAIARALVNHPALLLADEPTGNLDPQNAQEIMDLLVEIQKRGTTVIVVTHNKEIVNHMGKRVIALNEGAVHHDEKGGTYDI